MSLTPDKGSALPPLLEVEELLRRYTVLLELYAELESVSGIAFTAIENGSSPLLIRENLAMKMSVAERIVRESRVIAGMKRTLLEEGALDSRDRTRVRRREGELTRAVDRIVEQENRSRDLVMQRGVKITRR
jgi:hypothetical protein